MAGERADFLAAALEVLAQQYRRPNFKALVEVFARQFQELEDAAQQVLGERLLEPTGGATHGAIGEQLSVLERIVGQGVFLTADEVVRRAWIASRIRLNRSSGTGDDLLQIFALVLPAPLVAELTEYFPAALELRVDGGALASNLVEPLGRILQLGKAAGVGAQMVYALSPEAEVMRFAKTVAFLSADIPALAGTLAIPVNNVTGTFPDNGLGYPIRLGFGPDAEEFPGYDGFTGTEFSIDGYGEVANAHYIGEEVLLLPRRAGFGDGSSPGGGGKMGGAV